MADSVFWTSLLDNFQVKLLIFARVMGIFSFNPIYSRKNLPNWVKVGASLSLAVLMALNMDAPETVEFHTLGAFAVGIVIELFIGAVLGFITQLFLSTMLVSGDLMDTQSGLGMAKIYDASAGVQMPLYGSIMTYMFIMYFFATNAHLYYIQIFKLSFEAIPVGLDTINPNIGWIIVEYFGTVLMLAIKLALPIIVSQFILELAMGVLMKAVPQIQVMVVNIQLKLLFGLIILFLLIVPLSNYLDTYMRDMLESLKGILPLIPAQT